MVFLGYITTVLGYENYGRWAGMQRNGLLETITFMLTLYLSGRKT